MTDRRFDVTSVGETMLRLSVAPGQRLETATSVQTGAGGAEGNVLAALAALGRRCGYVTALPTNPLGRLAARQLRAAGIDLDAVTWDEDGRMGSYFVELAVASSARPTSVVYDRAGSSAAGLSTEAVDWAYALDTRLVHLTGITPALSDTAADVVSTLRRRARESGLAVSFDVNHRAKLWPPDRAAEILDPLVRDVDLLFCSRRDAEALFAATGAAEDVARALAERTGAAAVVVSSGARGAALWSEAGGVRFAAAPETAIVDRLGAGDALAAGVIDGWLDGDLAGGLSRGVALAALALGQHGDMLVTSRPELEEALSNDATAVKR